MKSVENSYLLQDDTLNVIDKIEITSNDPSPDGTLITLIDSLNEYILWMLLSDGKLYEYDFRTKNAIIIENSGQIRFFKVLYVN